MSTDCCPSIQATRGFALGDPVHEAGITRIAQVTKGIWNDNLSLHKKRLAPCKVRASHAGEEFDPPMGNSQPISLFAVPSKTAAEACLFFGFRRGALSSWWADCVWLHFCSAHQHASCGRSFHDSRSGHHPARSGAQAEFCQQRDVSRAEFDSAYEAAHNLPAAPTSSPLQVPKLHLAEHTIVQPDIPPNQLISKAKLPSLLLWSAQRPKLQLITPPQPQKVAINNTRPGTHPADA